MQDGFALKAGYPRGWLVSCCFKFERNPHLLAWQVGIVFSFLNDALCKMQDGFVVKAGYPRGWLVPSRFSIEKKSPRVCWQVGIFCALYDQGSALAVLTIKQPNSHP